VNHLVNLIQMTINFLFVYVSILLFYLLIYFKVSLFLKYQISQYKINNLLTFFWSLIAKCILIFFLFADTLRSLSFARR
jgi:heme/copper-type cytochrome/quinol oxidase subunit 2